MLKMLILFPSRPMRWQMFSTLAICSYDLDHSFSTFARFCIRTKWMTLRPKEAYFNLQKMKHLWENVDASFNEKKKKKESENRIFNIFPLWYGAYVFSSEKSFICLLYIKFCIKATVQFPFRKFQENSNITFVGIEVCFIEHAYQLFKIEFHSM